MLHDKFEIRLATTQETGIILDIVKQAFVQYCDAIGLKTIEALDETKDDVEKDMQEKEVFLAYCDDAPVGTIRVKYNGDKAFISRFSILPEYQSLGIGSKILDYMDQEFMAKQLKTVELYSAVDNTRLKDFYLNNGFQIISMDDSRGYQRGLFQKKYEKCEK